MTTTTFPTTLDTVATLPFLRPHGDQQPPGIATNGGDLLQYVRDAVVALEAVVGITNSAARSRMAKTVWFNLDNGAGTTVDDVLFYLPYAVTIRTARIVYVDATAGTVAAGNAKIGITVGGAEVVAATAYTNAATVGSVTAMTIITAGAANQIAANTMVTVRHTGVAATVAGQAYVEVEYTID